MSPKEAIEYLKDPIGKREQHDEAVNMAIEALQKFDAIATDIISRQDAIDLAYDCEDEFGKDVAFRFAHYLKQLPSAQTEQKKGRWIPVDDPSITGRCSVCGFESHLCEDDVYGYDYCPNCGTRLEVEQ